jgi:hypothetical protein
MYRFCDNTRVERAVMAANLRPLVRTGAVLFLARGGGWRRRGGQRLWERWPAPELRFGPASFRLLAWLLSLGPRTL